MNKEYYVKEVETGFVICRTDKTVPLPFNYISRQYAERDCMEFNRYGSIAVASYYYMYKVAGHSKLPKVARDYRYSRDKWLVENYAKFD